MENKNCEICGMYEDGKCTKFARDNVCGPCVPSTRKWLGDEIEDYVPVDRMCERGSIFGNHYIGLSIEDVRRLLKGEIAHIAGEYGIFVGLKDE